GVEDRAALAETVPARSARGHGDHPRPREPGAFGGLGDALGDLVAGDVREPEIEEEEVVVLAEDAAERLHAAPHGVGAVTEPLELCHEELTRTGRVVDDEGAEPGGDGEAPRGRARRA